MKVGCIHIESREELINNITFIPVSPKFKPLLIAVNAALVAMDLHLVPRGRVLDVDEDEIKEIICTIFENHIPREDSDENDQDIGGNDDDENAQ